MVADQVFLLREQALVHLGEYLLCEVRVFTAGHCHSHVLPVFWQLIGGIGVILYILRGARKMVVLEEVVLLSWLVVVLVIILIRLVRLI